MKSFLGPVDFVQLGMALEPAVEQETSAMVEREAIAQQQATQRKRSTVTGNLLAASVDCAREQPHHMKLVGHNQGILEEAANEVSEWLAEVHHHEADVVTTRNVLQAVLQFGGAPPLDHFHQATAFVVDQDRNKFAEAEGGISTKEVFIDADDFGPGIEPHPAFELELPIEGSVKKSSRATERPAHRLQIRKRLTGPKHRPLEALGEARPFADARNRLGEGLCAPFAAEAPLADVQHHLSVANRRVSNPGDSMVVNHARRCGAARADLEGGSLSDFEMGVVMPGEKPASGQFQFRQQNAA